MKNLTDAEIRKQAALRVFWTHHALVEAYRAANLCEEVPLNSFIAFVQRMPQSEFNACMFARRP